MTSNAALGAAIGHHSLSFQSTQKSQSPMCSIWLTWGMTVKKPTSASSSRTSNVLASLWCPSADSSAISSARMATLPDRWPDAGYAALARLMASRLSYMRGTVLKSSAKPEKKKYVAHANGKW